MLYTKKTLERFTKLELIDHSLSLQKLMSDTDKYKIKIHLPVRDKEDKNLRVLDFSYNWNNKLNCKSFTTVRLSKGINIDDKVLVKFKGKAIMVAQCLSKKVIFQSSFNEEMARIDTGYRLGEFNAVFSKMYPNADFTKTPFVWYLFQKLANPIPEVNGGIIVEALNINLDTTVL